MAWRAGRGPDEKRADGALQRQHERERKALKAGEEQATRISEKLQDRANKAQREGR